MDREAQPGGAYAAPTPFGAGIHATATRAALTPPVRHSPRQLATRLLVDLTAVAAAARAGRCQQAERPMEAACLMGLAVALEVASMLALAPRWRMWGARATEGYAMLATAATGAYLADRAPADDEAWRRPDVTAGMTWAATVAWRVTANWWEFIGEISAVAGASVDDSLLQRAASSRLEAARAAFTPLARHTPLRLAARLLVDAAAVAAAAGAARCWGVGKSPAAACLVGASFALEAASLVALAPRWRSLSARLFEGWGP